MSLAQSSVELSPKSPRKIGAEFRELLSTHKVRAVGEAKDETEEFLRAYSPSSKLSVFGTDIYIGKARQNPALRFFVCFVVQKKTIFPRIFYKDISLIWRCASHFISNEDDFWIGKGDVEDGMTKESTTDLPLEIQFALDSLNRKAKRKVIEDEDAPYLVLRNAPSGRIRAYADFTRMREEALKDPKRLIRGGKPIARFRKKNDPESLTIVSGFEPDFEQGLIDKRDSRSSMYGGDLSIFRFTSRNKKIQYMFFAAPKHVWIIPPQTLERQLSSFAVRVVDVHAPEDMFVPGFEYHYFDPDVDESEHFTQIPEGYAGAPNHVDGERADASAWIDALPVVKQFRRQVLGA